MSFASSPCAQTATAGVTLNWRAQSAYCKDRLTAKCRCYRMRKLVQEDGKELEWLEDRRPPHDEDAAQHDPAMMRARKLCVYAPACSNVSSRAGACCGCVGTEVEGCCAAMRGPAGASQ
eukprot:6179412-Pleurochrysis_carterae.AAC.1